jgi:hypothetical protein
MTDETIAALVGALVGAIGGGFATLVTSHFQSRSKQKDVFKIFEHFHSVWTSFSGGTIAQLRQDCPNLLDSLIQAQSIILESGHSTTALNFAKYVLAFKELNAQVQDGNHGTVHRYTENLEELFGSAREGLRGLC